MEQYLSFAFVTFEPVQLVRTLSATLSQNQKEVIVQLTALLRVHSLAL